MTKELPRLSVVCVWNDAAVRRECLDSSFAHADAAQVEYLPVDNVGQRFSSAGAALNHGARSARHEVVVLVHQDVHLHSLERLREVASHLMDETWGLIGACGVASDGTVVGTLRDRVQLIGADAPTPQPVDSVDEVLFMVRRDRLLAEPLTEDPRLSWHAYAVEYGARMRRQGLGVGAASAAITHNSMTINLDKLDVAHRAVATAYAELLPLHTTCGVLKATTPGGLRDSAFVRAHGWRKRWLRESRLALRVGRHRASRPTVLADIRLDVDTLDWPQHSPLHVVNLDPSGTIGQAADPLMLTRAGRPVGFSTAIDLDAIARLVVGAGARESFLVTNLGPAEVRALTSVVPTDRSTRVGVHERDVWLLVGPVAERSPAAWSSPRAVPLLVGA